MDKKLVTIPPLKVRRRDDRILVTIHRALLLLLPGDYQKDDSIETLTPTLHTIQVVRITPDHFKDWCQHFDDLLMKGDLVHER